MVYAITQVGTRLASIVIMTVQELINLLVLLPKTDRVVVEYDGQLYPIIRVCGRDVGKYPTYELLSGEHIWQIVQGRQLRRRRMRSISDNPK